MVVGAIGLVVSLLMTMMVSDRADTHTETRVVERDRLV